MAKDFPENRELVLCTVTKIMGTTVFVNIEEYGKVGAIATSEIAPGRIRNIRDYVTINKKIVCIVLRVNQEKGTIDLSLRRVSQKDSKEILDGYKKEKAALLILSIVLKDKSAQISENIKKKFRLSDFLEKLRANPAVAEEFMSNDEVKQISKLVAERIKEKKYEVRAVLSVSSNAPNGISIIKNALLSAKNAKIAYIGAPNYTVSVIGPSYKEAEKELKNAIEIITSKVRAAGGKIEAKI